VSFVSRDAVDKKLFSYITHEPSVGLMMCHAFAVKAKVERIPATLNQAFMINSGKVRRTRSQPGSGPLTTDTLSRSRSRSRCASPAA
jgi:hypothetical protein